jgi:hypothetical protein
MEITLSKQQMIEYFGIEKCRELFPDQFKKEKMHEIPLFDMTEDVEDAILTIADDMAFNEKHCKRCFLLNDNFIWRLLKRYDAEGTYRTYLVPTLRSEYKQRKRRKTVKA